MLNYFRYRYINDPHGRTQFLFTLYVLISLFLIWSQRIELDSYQHKINSLNATVLKNTRRLPFSSLPSSHVPSKSNSSHNFNMAINIPVFPLNDFKFISFPAEVKRVWFDVGAHKEAMYTYPHLKNQTDLGIIAFEPMFDMWGQLFMSKRHDRLYPIPAAIGPKDGYVTFRRAGTDMCSSIKEIDPEAANIRWPGGCKDTAFQIKVPCLSLETVIDLIPFETVEFVKIDAQGADFEVIASAGRNLHRIKSFVVEIQTEPLYKDSKAEEHFTSYFSERGFVLVKKKFQNKHEANLLYRNTKYPLPSNIPIDEFFADDKNPRLLSNKRRNP